MNGLKAKAIERAKQVLADEFKCTEFDDVEGYLFDFVAFNGFVVRFVAVRVVNELPDKAEFDHLPESARFENCVVDYVKKHPEREFSVVNFHQFNYRFNDKYTVEAHHLSKCFKTYM